MDKLWAYVAIGHRFKYLHSPFVLVLMIPSPSVDDEFHELKHEGKDLAY
jgi:hypothetical protein